MLFYSLYLLLICSLVVFVNKEVLEIKFQKLMEKTNYSIDMLVSKVKDFFYIEVEGVYGSLNSSMAETKKVISSTIVKLNHSSLYENNVVKKLIFMIEELLDKDILNKVKTKMINEGLIHPSEYIVFEYEFKKYLVLTQFMENPPMYNEQVKLILKEFASHKNEYYMFLEKFNGKISNSLKEKRNLNMFTTDEMFVLLYTNLFRENGYEEKLYPIFKNFRYSMHFLDIFNNKDIESIKYKCFKFNKDNKYSELIDLIITDIIDLQKRNQYLLLFKDKKICYLEGTGQCINGDEFSMDDFCLNGNTINFKGQDISVIESCHYLDSDIYQYIHVRMNRKHSSYNELKFQLLLNSNLVYYEFKQNKNISQKEIELGIDTNIINNQSEKEYKKFSLPSYDYKYQLNY